jgi:hypothetical protein
MGQYEPKNKKSLDTKNGFEGFIAEPTESPTLVIKTNLDENAKEENPYYKENSKDKQKFEGYFYE